MAGQYYGAERLGYVSQPPRTDWYSSPPPPQYGVPRLTQTNRVYPPMHPSNASSPPRNGLPTKRQARSASRKRHEVDDKTPRTIDVIGNGSQTTVSGHIDLLQHLPLHNKMHRRLLETFRREPGNYEGQYNNETANKAVVRDLGNGYLSIHFYHDITQIELSEFLVSKGWTTLAMSHDGKTTYEKWTNVIKRESRVSAARQPSVLRPAERYY